MPTSLFLVLVLIFSGNSLAEQCSSDLLEVPKELNNLEKTMKRFLKHKDFYSGCLLFQDDIRPNDSCALVEELRPRSLIRSWYRFGEPAPDKQYKERSSQVQVLRSKGIAIGGGTSLSVVNKYDFSEKQFDSKWLAVDLSGNAINDGDRQYASLSAPGFRSYLIQQLIEQANLGVTELHLGETNGKICYDDYSLGLKGNDGFVQWVAKKHYNKSREWWGAHLGEVGKAIFDKKPVTRKMLQEMDPTSLSNFKSEWGKEDSWHGTNEKDEPAFLAYAYRKNLENFLKELKTKLKKSGHKDISIDIWGSANWTKGLSTSPNAVFASPPDERWGINWNTEPNYDIQKDRERIKKIMIDEMNASAPAKMIYMFDHPKPFVTDFSKLSDSRQAFLTKFFADLCREIGAKFVLRSYSEIPKSLGPETKKVITEECLLQNLSN